jgi:hypothetical protein
VLLPPNPDWRWGLEGEHTPWYAGMRLFRRSHGEPLPLQIQRVMAALDQHLSARSG